jgi:hypothetical protein
MESGNILMSKPSKSSSKRRSGLKACIYQAITQTAVVLISQQKRNTGDVCSRSNDVWIKFFCAGKAFD